MFKIKLSTGLCTLLQLLAITDNPGHFFSLQIYHFNICLHFHVVLFSLYMCFCMVFSSSYKDNSLTRLTLGLRLVRLTLGLGIQLNGIMLAQHVPGSGFDPQHLQGGGERHPNNLILITLTKTLFPNQIVFQESRYYVECLPPNSLKFSCHCDGVKWKVELKRQLGYKAFINGLMLSWEEGVYYLESGWL